MALKPTGFSMVNLEDCYKIFSGKLTVSIVVRHNLYLKLIDYSE